MSEKVKAEGVCLDMEFLLDRNWRFHVPDLNREFADYESMKTAIEGSAAKVQSAKRRKLNVAAVTEDGKKLLVTGVHAGHGGLITTPKRERFSSGEVYVDTPLVAKALAEYRRLNHDIQRVEALLKTHDLVSHSYRQFDLSQHEPEIKRIEKLVELANKRSGESLADALSGIKPRKKIEF